MVYVILNFKYIGLGYNQILQYHLLSLTLLVVIYFVNNTDDHQLLLVMYKDPRLQLQHCLIVKVCLVFGRIRMQELRDRRPTLFHQVTSQFFIITRYKNPEYFSYKTLFDIVKQLHKCYVVACRVSGLSDWPHPTSLGALHTRSNGDCGGPECKAMDSSASLCSPIGSMSEHLQSRAAAASVPCNSLGVSNIGW